MRARVRQPRHPGSGAMENQAQRRQGLGCRQAGSGRSLVRGCEHKLGAGECAALQPGARPWPGRVAVSARDTGGAGRLPFQRQVKCRSCLRTPRLSLGKPRGLSPTQPRRKAKPLVARAAHANGLTAPSGSCRLSAVVRRLTSHPAFSRRDERARISGQRLPANMPMSPVCIAFACLPLGSVTLGLPP